MSNVEKTELKYIPQTTETTWYQRWYATHRDLSGLAQDPESVYTHFNEEDTELLIVPTTQLRDRFSHTMIGLDQIFPDDAEFPFTVLIVKNAKKTRYVIETTATERERDVLSQFDPAPIIDLDKKIPLLYQAAGTSCTQELLKQTKLNFIDTYVPFIRRLKEAGILKTNRPFITIRTDESVILELPKPDIDLHHYSQTVIPHPEVTSLHNLDTVYVLLGLELNNDFVEAVTKTKQAHEKYIIHSSDAVMRTTLAEILGYLSGVTNPHRIFKLSNDQIEQSKSYLKLYGFLRLLRALNLDTLHADDLPYQRNLYRNGVNFYNAHAFIDPNTKTQVRIEELFPNLITHFYLYLERIYGRNNPIRLIRK